MPERTPQQHAYDAAIGENADRWVSACGGLEQPFFIGDSEWLYVFNPRRHQHGFLGPDDIVYDSPHTREVL